MKRIILLAATLMVAIASRSEAANPDHVQRLLKTNQCPNCDLSGADLKDTNLFGANLVNANLKGANFTGANLGSANLTDADATGADFTKAYLDRATLENTNLSGTNLSEAYLKNAVTINAQFSKATFRGAKLGRINLAGANLRGVDLSDVDLSGAILSGFRSTGSTMPGGFPMGFDPSFLTQMVCRDPGNFPDSDEKFVEDLKRYGLEFSTVDLGGATLKGANLSNAILLKSDLTGANLTGANLTGTCLLSANLKGAILDEANLQSAVLKNARMDGASLKGTRNADLKNAIQSDAQAMAQEHEPKARMNVGTMLRSQQAYFLENDRFAVNLKELRIGVEDTEQYAYRVFAPGKRTEMIVVAAVPKTEGLKTYLGFVNVIGSGKNAISATKLCESQESKPVLPTLPKTAPKNQPMACPTGFVERDRN